MEEVKDYTETDQITVLVDEGGAYYFKWEHGFPTKVYLED